MPSPHLRWEVLAIPCVWLKIPPLLVTLLRSFRPQRAGISLELHMPFRAARNNIHASTVLDANFWENTPHSRVRKYNPYPTYPHKADLKDTCGDQGSSCHGLQAAQRNVLLGHRVNVCLQLHIFQDWDRVPGQQSSTQPSS